MMWAATVRRCPTGHARHPSQFGARLQLARALTQAPYLISYPPPTHTHFDHDVGVPYRIPCGEPPPSLRDPNVLCDHADRDNQSYGGTSVHHGRRGSCLPGVHTPTRTSVTEPSQAHRSRGEDDEEVRVELPYSRRELDPDEDPPLGERVVRRYDELRWRDEAPEDDGVVGLSYQQRSLGGGAPYGGEVWGTEPSIDCWGERPLLLKRGRVRELVRTLFVVGLSFTLVTFVVMGFEVASVYEPEGVSDCRGQAWEWEWEWCKGNDNWVYNMLITTLFLVFLLSTVSLLIFLLIRKPTCFSCCRDPFDIPNNNEEGADIHQQGLNTYLTESQGVVLKKRLSDSPPPYESPPDYHSLPPEVLVSARGLGVVESPSDGLLARVHGGRDQSQPNIPLQRGQTPRPPARRANKLKSFVARPSSTAAPLLSSAKPPLPSPPSSPPLCPSGALLGLTSSCRQPAHAEALPTPPPPPYECVMLQTEAAKATRKSC